MQNILIAEIKQEISTFNPVPSTEHDFVTHFGDEIVRVHRGLNSEMAGALDVFNQRNDIALKPTYSARAITSAGVLRATGWQHLASHFLEAIQAAANAAPIHGVYFSMHGAMSAEGELDPEGYLLAQTRAILGQRVPIVVSLDLHGILTDRMLEHSDAVVPYHTYPHTDFYPTGARAARLLLRILDGEVKPVTARVAIPALVRGDELITASGLFGRQIRMAEAFEASGGPSAGMFIGNPFTDVPELRCDSVVVSNDDPAAAAQLAERMAADFWACHEKMQVPLTSLTDAANLACELVPGTTILVDAADATSSGASGDSNAILGALMAANYGGRALLPIVDAPAVQAAFAAGIGATIQVTIGGALDKKRYTPIQMTLKVRLLSDGDFVSESDGAVWHGGLTAVLQNEHYTIVATSRAVSLYNRSLFYAHGCDPAKYDCVIVKSPQCERHMFRDWSARYIDVDAPGSTSANVRSLGHTIAQRPLWPLDAVEHFTPKARIFRRPV